MRATFRTIAALCLTALPARAGLMPSAVLYHPMAGGALNTIAGLNVLSDLDTTQPGSTDGVSQGWTSLVASPADGSAASAYTLNRGASGSTGSDDPTLSGAAGTNAAYWSFNGAQNFTLAGANTAYLAALQNDSENFWVAMTVNLGTAASQVLWSTQTSATTVGLTLIMSQSTTPRFNMTQYLTSSRQIVAYSPTVNLGADYAVIVSHAAGGNTRIWVNGGAANQALSFGSGSYTASHALNVGSRASSLYLGSGAKVRSFAIGTDALSDAQAYAIMRRLEARHGVDYDGNGTVGG